MLMDFYLLPLKIAPMSGLGLIGGDIYNKEITVSKYFYVTKASLNYDYNYLALNYTMYDFANMEYTLSIYSSTNPYIPFWYLPYVNNIIPPSSEVLNIDIKIEGIE